MCPVIPHCHLFLGYERVPPPLHNITWQAHPFISEVTTCSVEQNIKAASQFDSQLVPTSTHPMSTRTHVNSYPCQLVPPIDVNSYHKGCQLVPQVMSTRTQQDRCQIMIRVDISYHTTYVNSYPCQLAPLIDVNSYHH